MTTKVFFEEVCIELYKSGESYRVEMIDRRCYIKRSIADMIATEKREDPHLVALLLSYIRVSLHEYNRGCSKDRRDKQFSDDVLFTAISDMLDKHTIEKLICCFNSMKWIEIKSIIESKNPSLKIEQVC